MSEEQQYSRAVSYRHIIQSAPIIKPLYYHDIFQNKNKKSIVCIARQKEQVASKLKKFAESSVCMDGIRKKQNFFFDIQHVISSGCCNPNLRT